ncbi:MAG: HAD-IA family hydrolase, partial [Pseudomonadota bacterium]
HHDVMPEQFLTEAHDIDYSELTHDPELFHAIANTQGRKIIHTNGPRCHAQAVLTALGYSELFDTVYALEDANLISKPHADAFETVHAQAGIDPSRAAMIEDDARNLAAPHDLAMCTVWLDHGHANETPDHVHHHVNCLTTFLKSELQQLT